LRWDILIPAVIVGVIMLALGLLIGYIWRKKVAEAQISSAEEYAKKVMEEAVTAAEAKSKEMLVEAKEDILKAKTEAERDNKERR
jgi:ribonuclease Y